ncbi:MAG: sugar phosphate nucleotidyltransferase [Bacteroidia bacterium]
MIAHTHAVILAGGSGTRFWPWSRAAQPKQFLDVLGIGKTLLQSTYVRLARLLPPERIWVIGNSQHADLLAQQVPEIPPSNRLLEPLQRNTAPSILWASQVIARQAADPLLWVLPADHFIPDEELFIHLMRRVLENCDFSEAIYTVGIQPRYPHTGYGYIQFVPTSDALCHPVKTFTEKPSRELAELFLQSGDFLWNAGMFLGRAAVFQKAFQEHAPEIYEVFQEAAELENDSEALLRAFQRVPSISFDYAIMEKYQPVRVVVGEFRWWDLGGWNAVYEVSPQDEKKNALRSPALLREVEGSFFLSTLPRKLIVAEGLKDYLVVDTMDALLILPRSQEQSLRDWVQRLRSEGKVDYL